MNVSRTINLVAIVLGGAVAIYSQAEANQNTYFLIGGIMLLMFGVYRTSRNIPSKYDKEEESFVKTEKKDED